MPTAPLSEPAEDGLSLSSPDVDIQELDILNDFLTDDGDAAMELMLGHAGCFY